MAQKTLGAITIASAGTRVRVTSSHVGCQSYLVQGLPGNTGYCAVGDSTVVATNATGTYGYVAMPASDNSSLPAFTATIVNAPAGFDLSNIYLDGSHSGDKYVVSYVEQ